MQSIIIAQNSGRCVNIPPLYNGEKVLHRLVRMLGSFCSGCLILCPPEDEQSLQAQLADYAGRVVFYHSLHELAQSTLGDRSLLLRGDAVLSRDIFDALLQSKEENTALISKQVSLHQDAYARLDMNEIKEIGAHLLPAPGIFAHFPVYKLKKPAVIHMLKALEQQPDLYTAADGLIKSGIPLHALTCPPESFISIGSDHPAACSTALRAADVRLLPVLRGAGSLLELPAILHRHRFKKPLLVLDESALCSPLSGYLDYIGLNYTQACVSAQPCVQEIQSLFEQYSAHGCDVLICAGDTAAHHAAKALKALIPLNGDTELLFSSLHYSPVFCIGVPTDGEADAFLQPAATLWKDSAAHTLSHDGLLLEYVLLDDCMLPPAPACSAALPAAHTKEKKGLLKRLSFFYAALRCERQYRMVLFESCGGAAYAGSPKALYEQMRDDAQYDGFVFVWSFTDPAEQRHLSQNARTRVVEKHSWAYIKACAQARYWITDENLMPRYITPGKNRVYVCAPHGQWWHTKECGLLSMRARKRLTHLLSPSQAFSDRIADTFKLSGFSKERILVETGCPYNDFLFTYTQNDVLRAKMALRISLHKKVVLYCARKDVQPRTNACAPLDFALLQRQLGDDYVLLLRHAHANEAKPACLAASPEAVLDVAHVEDINELYIISDLLVSSEVGALFDYANLRRPMVFCPQDAAGCEREWASAYLGLHTTLPARVVHTQHELADAIRESLAQFVYDEKYRAFNAAFNSLNGALCAQRALESIIDRKKVPSSLQQWRSKLKPAMNHFFSKFSALFRSRGLYWSQNSRRLASYRNKYAGKRCFLVGNGPSLTIEDLNKIQGELSFGCNRINMVFDLTAWRPDFYCLSEQVLAKTISRDLKKSGSTLFVSRSAYKQMAHKPADTVYVCNVRPWPYYVRGNMLAYYVPSFGTVMSFMIELAMYMGFKEIYLLGVDATSSQTDGHFTHHYYDDEIKALEHQKAGRYFGEGDALAQFGDWMVQRSLYAYEQLRRYADQHGHHIYNATRGGKLEIFERADLDEVLANETV